MKTVNKLFYSSIKFFKEKGNEYRIRTCVSLDDDCNNHICEWSITADIREKNKYGAYREYKMGCVHNEIAEHYPELAKFIPLHDSNCYGAPLYPVQNGMYHMKNSGKEVAMNYLRITEKEYGMLLEALDDDLYFKYLLFDMGIVDRWRKESEEFIEYIEKLRNVKWVNPYKPEEERFTLVLTEEEKRLMEDRTSAGYYSESNIESRRKARHTIAMAEKRAKICERFDKKIMENEIEKKVYLYIFDHGLSTDNMIYYTSRNKVVFNWIDYCKKITQEEFVDFMNNIDYSQLPKGIEFEIK